MRTWIWGGVALSAVLFTAGCKIETTTDTDGLGGSTGLGGGNSGGSAQGGSSSGGNTSSGGAKSSGGQSGNAGSTSDAGAGGEAPADIGFSPSNVPSTAVSGQSNADLVLGGATCGNTSVRLDTDTGAIGGCSLKAGVDYAFAQVEQGDGSKVGVFIANKIRIEQTITATVDGQLPLVLLARDTLQIIGKLQAAGAHTEAVAGGFPGVSNVSNTPGNGPGAGGAGKVGGGGSYCGKGGQSATKTSAGGTTYSTPEIVPLVGGSSGGAAGIWDSGAGGGAVQLIAGTSIQISATGVVNVGGGGGGQGSNGGGSGGAILLEAPTVTVAGVLAANGGGGGGGTGSDKGQNGMPSSTPATGGGTGAKGGDGSAAASVDGEAGAISGTDEGGGGGGAGVIRINTATGSATITGTVSPSLGSACATQGILK